MNKLVYDFSFIISIQEQEHFTCTAYSALFSVRDAAKFYVRVFLFFTEIVSFQFQM